jgi:hypothetical protein
MQEFSGSFLLLAYQTAVGGLCAVAATPFHDLERGFYKSTVTVLFVIGLLGFTGKVEMSGRVLSGGMDGIVITELVVYGLFVVSLGLYLSSLWGERAAFRARSFALALLVGIGGLFLSSQRFHQASLVSWEALIYPASFLLSALLLGSVTVGMLLGHWYLIDVGQTIDPFVQVFRFFLRVLILQTLFLLTLPFLLYALASPRAFVALGELWEGHFGLLLGRFATAQLGPLVLSYMIWRTLQIPHTMAATGLFYIALLGVFVGEILGRQILALTSLPF